MIQDGQIVLIRFPESDQSKGKLRPALVIRRLPGRHDDWLICSISSQVSRQLPGFDELIRDTDPALALDLARRLACPTPRPLEGQAPG